MVVKASWPLGVAATARVGSAVDLQRLEQVIAAARRADHQQAAPQAQQQRTGAEQMGDAPESVRLLPGAVGGDQQQCTPQADPQGFIQHRAQHQQRGGEEQEAEDAFEQVHPGAGFGQEAIAHRHQQQQRHTDADAHGEQNQPAMQRIAALRDIEQGAGQRRGHARADQQAGQRAQDTRADQAATALIARDIFQAITHGHRQLQLEEAEHRQRQQHKHRGETAQQPRVLQQCLQVRPEQRRQHTHRRIHQRHAHHIAAGQGKTTSWAWRHCRRSNRPESAASARSKG